MGVRVEISDVDLSSGTFTVTPTYSGFVVVGSSTLYPSAVTASFNNPSPFPATPLADLASLNDGIAPRDMAGATVVSNVLVTVPAGTFTADEMTLNNITFWVETHSGLVLKATGPFRGFIVTPPGQTGSVELVSTNVPTGVFSPLSFLTPDALAIIAAVVTIVGVSIAATRKRMKALSTPAARVSPPPTAVPSSTLDSKVVRLKKMLDDGLITQKDYDDQVKKLSDK